MVIGEWSPCLYLHLYVLCLTFHSVLLRREWVSIWVGIRQWAILIQPHILMSFVWIRKQNIRFIFCVDLETEAVLSHRSSKNMRRDVCKFQLAFSRKKTVGVFGILNILIDKHWVLSLLINLLKLYVFCLMCTCHIYIWCNTEMSESYSYVNITGQRKENSNIRRLRGEHLV